MKNYLFLSLTAIIGCNIFAADSSSNHSAGHYISAAVEAEDYVVFDEKRCLFSKEEINALDRVIELIGKSKQYKNGDNGQTHEYAHYGTIAIQLIPSDALNSTAYVIPKDADWISFTESYLKSYLEEEIYTMPIIETLFRKVVSALPAPPAGKGHILDLKLVCSHEASHENLRKHQDGANYVFTLITNVKDIEGGEMFIYKLNAKGRSSLQADKYYYGDAGKFLFKGPAQAGAGYVIKERPDNRADESNWSAIVHGHTAWNKIKGATNPTRNIVIVRVHYYSLEKNELGNYNVGKRLYRND